MNELWEEMKMGCSETGFGRQKDGGDQKKQRWVGI